MVILHSYVSHYQRKITIWGSLFSQNRRMVPTKPLQQRVLASFFLTLIFPESQAVVTSHLEFLHNCMACDQTLAKSVAGFGCWPQWILFPTGLASIILSYQKADVRPRRLLHPYCFLTIYIYEGLPTWGYPQLIQVTVVTILVVSHPWWIGDPLC